MRGRRGRENGDLRELKKQERGMVGDKAIWDGKGKRTRDLLSNSNSKKQS